MIEDCKPGCLACAADKWTEDHYGDCPTCQGKGFPCAKMSDILALRDSIYDQMFPI